MDEKSVFMYIKQTPLVTTTYAAKTLIERYFGFSARCLLIFYLALVEHAFAQVTTLEFAVNPSSVTQQEVYHLLARNFEAQNPDIAVKVSTRVFSEHKQMITGLLHGESTNADIILCYAGEQLMSLIKTERISNLSEIWHQQNLDQVFTPQIRQSVSFDKKPFAVPLNYYQWGFYYKKPLFRKLGLTAPQTWTEFLQLIRELKEKNITPLLLTGETSWTLAAWFDYINLRINGLSFHMELLSGQIPFTDHRVKEIFTYWAEVIEAGAFNPEQLNLSWTQGLPYLYRDYVAMSLMGNFFIAQVPEPVVDSLGYFPFPSIRQDMPVYEDVPLDVAVLNETSAKKEAAQRFLIYLAQAETQTILSNYVGKISANKLSKSRALYFTEQGKHQIERAAGFAQFFDRDTPKAFSDKALLLFQEFLANPKQIDQILEKFEAARKSTFIGKN